MIDADDLNRKCDALLEALQKAFRFKALTLAQAVRKAGRRLPRRLRAQASVLLDAQAKVAHPKQAVTLDSGAISKAYKEITVHLRTVDPTARRKDVVLGVLATNAMNIILISAALVAVLIWRGYL